MHDFCLWCMYQPSSPAYKETFRMLLRGDEINADIEKKEWRKMHVAHLVSSHLKWCMGGDSLMCVAITFVSGFSVDTNTHT